MPGFWKEINLQNYRTRMQQMYRQAQTLQKYPEQWKRYLKLTNY